MSKEDNGSPAGRVQRINEEIQHVASLFNVTSWEREFLESIQGRSSLSDKQEKILSKIEAKVFGDES